MWLLAGQWDLHLQGHGPLLQNTRHCLVNNSALCIVGFKIVNQFCSKLESFFIFVQKCLFWGKQASHPPYPKKKCHFVAIWCKVITHSTAPSHIYLLVWLCFFTWYTCPFSLVWRSWANIPNILQELKDKSKTSDPMMYGKICSFSHC